MEINKLPVELTVVWNGHFNIDNPAQNKGAEAEEAGREEQPHSGRAIRAHPPRPQHPLPCDCSSGWAAPGRAVEGAGLAGSSQLTGPLLMGRLHPPSHVLCPSLFTSKGRGDKAAHVPYRGQDHAPVHIPGSLLCPYLQAPLPSACSSPL